MAGLDKNGSWARHDMHVQGSSAVAGVYHRGLISFSYFQRTCLRHAKQASDLDICFIYTCQGSVSVSISSHDPNSVPATVARDPAIGVNVSGLGSFLFMTRPPDRIQRCNDATDICAARGRGKKDQPKVI